MSDKSVDERIDLLEEGELKHMDLMDLFEEMTFREKWRRVFEGLKMPHDTGGYKFARLQLIRLLSPASAVIVPVIMFALIAFFASMTPEPVRTMQVDILEPETMEELEEIEPPEIEPPEPPDPIEVDFTPDPTLPPSEVAAPPVEYSPQPAEFDSVAMTRSPVIMRGIYGSRNPGARGQAVARFGGDGTQGAVLRALRWLKQNQSSEGSWGSDRTAITALGLLAYLGYGETPASPEFGDTIERAIQFLIGAQRDNGRFQYSDRHEYTLPIAALALSEAYAITRIPMVKTAAEKAVEVIVKGQNAHGGFNYNLKGSGDTRNDISYIAWCVQAMKAAHVAGLYVDGLEEAMRKAVAGVRMNYRSRGGSSDGGTFNYVADRAGNLGITSAGALSLQFLGQPQAEQTQSAIAWINENSVVSWDPSAIDSSHRRDPVYYWYYTTQVMFQQGGETWNNWNRQFSPVLVQNQTIIPAEQSGYTCHEGKSHAIGSWPPPAGMGARQGNNPAYHTILCTLMLEVYYRYLPTFQQPDDVEQRRDLDDDDDIQINIVETQINSGRSGGLIPAGV